MSADWQADVAEFMRAMGQEVRTVPIGAIEDLEIHEYGLAVNLISEEFGELLDAKTVPDLADAAADLIYTVCGLMNRYGVTLQPIWDEVHRSNMSKLGGEKRPDGKQMKGPGYFKPNIEKCLKDQGWQGGRDD